jgi:phytol kinase
VTTSEWLAVMGVLAGLLLGLSLLHALAVRSGVAPEVARKSVHVAMGAVCVIFPWIFDRPLPVWVLAACVTVLFGMLRVIPSLRRGNGSVLHGIKRLSYGEMLFAPAVAVVFHGARGDAILYMIPIGILTVADTASALAGTRWGKRHYRCGEGFKTVEGSAIFLTTAFLCVFVPLVCSGRVDVVHALWIGLILATLAMMAEGISDRGFDNLVIPLGCFFVLNRLLPLDTPALAWRIIVIVLLLALMVPGTRWSTLNGSALLGGVLLGYGCAVLADWRFALPPVAVFVCHVVTARRYKLTKVFDHRSDVMWAHALGCLPWVVLASGGILPKLTCLAGVSFAMATQLAMLDMTTLSWLGRFSPQPLRSTLKGWLIAGLPGLVWFWPDYGRLWLSLGMALIVSLLATSLLHRIRPRYRGHATKLWMIAGFLALAASLSALLIHP